MIRILSKEEIEKSHQELELWWNSLDWGLKYKIHEFVAPFLKRIEMEHLCYVKNEHILYAARGVFNQAKEEVPIILCKRQCGYRTDNDREKWEDLIKKNLSE